MTGTADLVGDLVGRYPDRRDNADEPNDPAEADLVMCTDPAVSSANASRLRAGETTGSDTARFTGMGMDA
jgi:hypothetical protein